MKYQCGECGEIFNETKGVMMHFSTMSWEGHYFMCDKCIKEANE